MPVGPKLAATDTLAAATAAAKDYLVATAAASFAWLAVQAWQARPQKLAVASEQLV